MPFYSFANPTNPDEIVEVLMGMNDIHEYTVDGIKWDRVWLNPTASIDTKINPNSEADFVNKTANKKGTLGDLADQSLELSKKRAADHGGTDPVKQKYYEDYAKKRSGMRHQQEVKEKMPKTFVI